MRLANVEFEGEKRATLAADGTLFDLTDFFDRRCEDVVKLFAWNIAPERILEATKCSEIRLDPARVRFRAPVANPDKIFGIGMNYHSFVAAARAVGMPIPPGKIWFQRSASCVAGPTEEIWLPAGARDLDYEAELAIVIGRPGRNLSIQQAREAIGGYTIANDVTLREAAARSLVLAKSCDTHTPLGPWIVTPDELGDARDLAIRTFVNGELRQSASTSDMIHACDVLIAEISSACQLNPGDIILTGTPAGCGIFQRPPSALQVGDRVRIEIEGIGAIENRVVAEPAGNPGGPSRQSLDPLGLP